MITNVFGSALCVVLAIVVFIFLCYKNMHTGIAALIAAFIAAFGSTNTLAVSMLQVFPQGVGTLVTQMFFVFTASGLLAYLMDKTGAAMAVGKTMVKWMGVERSWLAITITTVILLLEHGKFEPAADIAKWSARGIESKVKTGDPVGRRP